MTPHKRKRNKSHKTVERRAVIGKPASEPTRSRGFSWARLATYRAPSIHRYFGGPWRMHLPFAYDLVRELRPAVFVELGVYKGESYFTFCQSVQENNLATKCYGVDTWRGDVHGGLYGPKVGNEVVAYNSRYSGFSHLLAMTFKEAANEFADRSIDLLHIDGAHRYEDVKEDFETWLPKLSNNGIVLFHDVLVRDGGFGVYTLWEEIARPRASFLFAFGHGLGVWGKSPISKTGAPFVRALFLANSEEKKVISNHYRAMAAAVESSGTAEPNRSAHEEAPAYLESFPSQAGVSCPEYASKMEVIPGRWCRLKTDLPWGLGDGSAPFRFDPVDRVGVVDIASVALRSGVTREILWRANAKGGLNELVVRGTALRLPHSRLLRLVVYSDDPQVCLPPLKNEAFQEPLALEILLRFDVAPDSIERAISAWNDASVPSDSPAREEQPQELLVRDISGQPVPELPEDGKITMVVYSAENGDYSEDRSIPVTYAAQRWSRLDIALDRGSGTEPLRIDPLPAIGLVDVAAITIRSAISGEVLWRANGDGGLEALRVSGSAVRIPHPHLARVLSYGQDPQIYLPAFPGGEFDGPLRLELWLKTETGFDAIRKGISALAVVSAQSFAATGQTRGLLEPTTRDASHKDGEIQSLRSELEKTVQEREEVQREKEALEEKVQALGAQLDKGPERLSPMNREFASRASELANSRQELALAKNELTALASEVDQFREERATQHSELISRASEIQSQSSQLKHARDELAAAQSKCRAFAEELFSGKELLASQREAKNELIHELGIAREKISSLNRELALIKDSPLWRYGSRFRKLRGREPATKSPQLADDKRKRKKEKLPYISWVDFPTEPSVEGERVTVSGWLLAPVGEKIHGIRVMANGEYFLGEHGFGREDVATVFSDRVDATHPGFRISIDTTLSVGIHELAIQVLTTGSWITVCVHGHEVRTVDQAAESLRRAPHDFTEVAAGIPEASPSGAISAREEIDFEGSFENPPEAATNEHGLLLITGWLFLKTREMVALVARLHEGEEVRLTHSLPRPDVASHFPAFPSAIDSGFVGYVPIDVGFSGRTRLEIEAVLKDGSRVRCFQRDLIVSVPVASPVGPRRELSDDDRYARWIKTNRLTPYLLRKMTQDASRVAKSGPQISIIVPIFNTPAPYLEALIESVRTQLYPNWQLCLADDASTQPHVRQILERAAAADSRIEVLFRKRNGHIVKASNSALTLAKGDYVGLLDHDDLLTPDALLHVAEAVVSEPALDLLYTDEDKLSPEGKRYDPIFKGSYSPEMSLTHNYIQHFAVIRRDLLQEVGGFREGFEGAQDLDLYLRVLEKTTPERVRHLPFVCYHWRSHPESTASSGAQKSYVFDSARKSIAQTLKRRRLRAIPFLPEWAAAANCCLYQLKWSPDLLKENPVTIVIPTKNRRDLLQKCLISLERTVEAAHVQLIIVDDFSDEESTRQYLKRLGSRSRLPCRVIQPRQRSVEFNFAQLINEGVAAANTPLVLLLNNDTEALNAGWLEEMVGWMSIENVGAVGAKLLYPDDTIQHAGVLVGSHGGLAEHIFHRLPKNEIGFNFLTHAARNVSAVTAACLLTSKAAFDEVGGFDQKDFALEYNDVDFCLRLGRAGKRIVFTPQATLLHHCGQSRGEGWRPMEHLNFLRRHGGMNDPYYNENLDLNQMPVVVNPDHFVHSDRVGKLKVLMVSHNLNLEGAPKVLFDHAAYFASIGGYDVTMISRQDGPLRGPVESAGILLRITEGVLPQPLESTLEYKKRLRKIGAGLDITSFDLVVCNTLTGFWGVVLARLYNLPVIWHIHESTTVDAFFRFDPVPPGLVEDCLASADRVAFEADATRQLYARYQGRDNFKTISGSIDVSVIDRFRAQHSQRSLKVKHGLDPNKLVVSLIGTTCARKGHLVFVRAIELLQAKTSIDTGKLCFVMLGARESPYLDLLRSRLGTIRDTDTRLIKECREVFDFYRLTDIFICASFQESFPRVILEAMAFKLPIISTDVFGIPEIVEHEGEGLLVPAGDPSQLAATIEWLVNAPKSREELGEKAHAKVTRLFNSSRQLNRQLDLTKEVVARHV